ncbi:hypothetical protein O181_030964 [Austropuccinia psidii MF-1]|uniref:CCHC-type domain-containing protein n=1 Tax=Austropuccinia psidii MF-1 TaxID=1389203 RepID=A0A9Q3CTX5_9BASI|nr:hypothetical protein [Austropuccinia psidii MF-1]
MKPQPQDHVMDNLYNQEDIKPDAILVNKARNPPQYQDGDNMSYCEREALKQLPEASSWPKFSGTGDYDHMELIDYIYGLFTNVPSIPDYWITARLNTEFKGYASIWVELKHTPRERVAEVGKKKNACHNCGSTDHYANNCPKAKNKVYAVEQVPEEKSSTKDSESDSLGDSIREQSDEYQDPREEILVEHQEEKPPEIQDIQLEEGIPQDTENKKLCKHTQDAQTFLATSAKGMEYIHGTATNITVCIDNSQHPLIIDSGADCSIVARKYLDHHFPNWEKQLLPTKAKDFKSS